MFDAIFPKHWTTLQRLMWLKTNALARAVYEIVTGNPVSFTAKAAPLRKLSVAFSPVQDLHGYDSPWPAGGGKNKFDPSAWIALGTNTQYYSVTGEVITVTANDNAGISQRLFDVEAGETYSAFYDGDFSSMRVFDSTAATLVSGNSFTFTAPENGKIAVKFLATFYPVSGRFILVKGSTIPTAWSPYSNICPISGWDSLNVEQRGKNLFDKQLGNTTYAELDTVAGEQYTVSAKMIDPEVGTYLLISKTPVEASTWSTIAYVISNRTVTPRTFTAEDGYKYALWSNSSYTNIKEVQLELGTTATEYVPYNPSSRSISITLGSTVYSGYVDVVTGLGEVTMASVDLGTLDWTYYGSLLLFATKVVDGKPTGGSTPSSNVFCSQYAKFVGGYRQLPDDSIMAGSNFFEASSCAVVVHDETYTDAAAFKTAVTGVQLVYELATPIPIQLTPQEVQSLLGDNVMWSDANGDLTVEYRSN